MGMTASRLGQKPIQPVDFFECRDGWIFVCCIEDHQWDKLVDLMGNPEWASLELFENRLTRAANWDGLKLFLQEWMQTQSVMELYRAGQARRIPLAPVSTMADLLVSDHLKSRGFFALVDHPVAGSFRYPGAPYGFAVTPWEIRRAAPLLGQHNAEVYGEAGLDAEALRRLADRGVV
jgi:crotonobetainyl-CoA:carnitine CoA-transferase CaiB-like acyl-CoA transferase